MEGTLTCILNCKAGSDEAASAQAMIERIAGERGRSVRVVVCSDGEDIGALARDARETSGAVVAGGGDGTVSTVAAALVDSDVPLGVLPIGTLNHFAKDLAIPLDLEGAVQTLFTAKTMRVDVGEVNGRVFLNNSSVGLYPHIVREREEMQEQGRSKWTALLQAAVRVLRRGVTLKISMEDDQGAFRSIDTSFLFVGNNSYETTGLQIGKRARLNGGMLWLCVAPDASRAKLFSAAVAALLGRVGATSLVIRETNEALIATHRPRLHVATDGEVTVMRTPLRYRIRPRALAVLVPG